MSMRAAPNTRLTICEVLRQINDLCQGDSPRDNLIRKKLATAEIMAKKMIHKLLQYNKDFEKDWWAKNPDYEETLIRELKTYKIAKVKRF
jgi:hypothetical protein